MPSYPRWSASQLRRDLTARAAQHARTHSLLHDISPGPDPAIVFGREEHSEPARHGNFHPAAYAAICANPDWLRRLAKPHTASRRSIARKDWRWMELDSASSSDALLMSIFCHPEVFNGTRLAAPVAALLNVDPASTLCFGASPGVPLNTPLKTRSKKSPSRERLDRTEIDLTLTSPHSTLFLEAKLTESNFQTAAPTLIERYRDLEAVFDIDRLPRKTSSAAAPTPHRDRWDVIPTYSPEPDLHESFNQTHKPSIRFNSYQLIRNVLAAYASDSAFCVLLDARRHDLIEQWYAILSAVHSHTFATRLKLLTWQELATTLAVDLQTFLAAKYGITS